MKTYGPDITKNGNYVVKLYQRDSEKEVFLEFHTDNPAYANVYFDAISDVVSNSGAVDAKYNLEWTKKSQLKKKKGVK